MMSTRLLVHVLQQDKHEGTGPVLRLTSVPFGLLAIGLNRNEQCL